MPTPTRPTSYPAWTQGNLPARDEPTGAEKETGFSPDFRPPCEWHNYLFGINSDWIDWLDYITQQHESEIVALQAAIAGLGFKSETPTGTVGSGQLVFTLAHTPATADGVFVFIDGKEVEEFTLVGQTITFAAGFEPTDVGQSFYCRYYVLTGGGGGGGGGGSGRYTVFGSEGSPIMISGASSVSVSTDDRQLRFLKSTGGEVTIGVAPQVGPGANVGDELLFTGVDDADYVKLLDGNGLKLNGPVLLKSGQTIELYWTGSVWKEKTRS